MSGICGIVYLNNKTVENELTTMTQRLAHRGPDGTYLYQNQNAALAQLQLSVSEQSFYEKQIHVNKTGWVIVADVRLDNREDLAAKLGFVFEPNALKIPDSELIMAAYARWGNDCPDWLVGDFAFVIYQPQSNTIFCARDPMGLRSLFYYYLPNQVFVFASEIKALLALDFVPQTINKEKIALYLSWADSSMPAQADTFYAQVFRVLSGHWAEITPDNLRTQFYWKLNLSRFEYLKTDEDFALAFKEIFFEAVRCRVQSHFGVASHLSGGLDSSSVSVAARYFLQPQDRQLITLHHKPSHSSADETEYANAVVAQGGCTHHSVAPLSGYYRATAQINDMADRPQIWTQPANVHLSWPQLVQQLGARTVLTGSEGDATVSHGREYFQELLVERNWHGFWQAAGQLAAIKSSPQNEVAALQIADFINDDWNWYDISTLAWLTGQVVKTCPKNVFQLAKSIVKRVLKGSTVALSASPLASRWAKKVLRQYQKAIHDPGDTRLPLALRHHWRTMRYNAIMENNEQYEAVAAHHGYEICHPFYDRRLVELCLATPARVKFGKGYGRGQMRDAMRDHLPESIRTRTSKVEFSQNILFHFDQEKIPLAAFCLQHQSAVDFFVDFDKLKKNSSEARSKKISVFYLRRVAELAIWLKKGVE